MQCICTCSLPSDDVVWKNWKICSNNRCEVDKVCYRRKILSGNGTNLFLFSYSSVRIDFLTAWEWKPIATAYAEQMLTVYNTGYCPWYCAFNGRNEDRKKKRHEFTFGYSIYDAGKLAETALSSPTHTNTHTYKYSHIQTPAPLLHWNIGTCDVHTRTSWKHLIMCNVETNPFLTRDMLVLQYHSYEKVIRSP